MSKNWTQGDEITADGLNNQGLKVVAQDTPVLTLKIHPGVAIVDGTIVKYAGGNTPSISAPSSNPRIDLVAINSAGTISIVAGSENASPTAPAYPADKTVLAEVYCKVSMTQIFNTDQGSGKGYVYRDARPLGAGITLIDVSTGAPDAGKGIKTDAAGKIGVSFLPVPYYFQIHSYGAANYNGSGGNLQISSAPDGSAMYWGHVSSSNSDMVYIFGRNKAGSYPNRDVILTDPGGSGYWWEGGPTAEVGAYAYSMFWQSSYGGGVNGNVFRVVRSVKKTGASPTTMTISGGTVLNGGSMRGDNTFMYSDGTFLYVWKTGTTWEKYSISGTTITYVSDITAFAIAAGMGIASDNENVYTLTVSGGVYTLTKYNSNGTSSIESKVVFMNGSLLSASSSTTVKGIAIAGPGQLYMIVFVTFSTATVNNTGGAYYFIPVATS